MSLAFTNKQKWNTYEQEENKLKNYNAVLLIQEIFLLYKLTFFYISNHLAC